MAGRFFYPIFSSLVIWVSISDIAINKKANTIFLMLCFIFLIDNIAQTSILTGNKRNLYGISNEREAYVNETGFFNTKTLAFRFFPDGNTVNEGKALKPDNKEYKFIENYRWSGLKGYYAGPNVILVDGFALGDAFLARQPIKNNVKPYPGHYMREIPKNYLDALRTGDPDKLSSEYSEAFKKIQLITTYNIFDRERLLTIINSN